MDSITVIASASIPRRSNWKYGALYLASLRLRAENR